MQKVFYNQRWMPNEAMIRLWAVPIPERYQLLHPGQINPFFRDKLRVLLLQEPEEVRFALMEDMLALPPTPDVEEEIWQILSHQAFLNQKGELVRRVEAKRLDPGVVLESYSPVEVQKIYRSVTLESLLSVLSDSWG